DPVKFSRFIAFFIVLFYFKDSLFMGTCDIKCFLDAPGRLVDGFRQLLAAHKFFVSCKKTHSLIFSSFPFLHSPLPKSPDTNPVLVHIPPTDSTATLSFPATALHHRLP